MGSVADLFIDSIEFEAILAAYLGLIVALVGLCLAGLWRRVG
jgi:hypothetical protein